MNRTKRKILINMCGAVIGALWLLVAALQGQTRMPQDNWYFYKTFGGYGSGPGQLNSPYGLCVGPNDRICIADTYNNRIQIFDDEGNLQASFAVSDPRDVAAGPDGFLYVAESGADRIGKYDMSGNFISAFASLVDPSEVAIRGDGLLVVYFYSNQNPGKFRTYQTNGIEKATWSRSDASDLAFSADGKICARRSNRIAVFSEDGIFERETYYAEDYYTMYDVLKAGPDGRIYNFNGGDRRIRAFTDLTLAPDFNISAASIPQAGCMAITGKGDLILIGDNKVYIYRSCFRTMGPLVRNAIPIPRVEKVAQRVNSTLVDVDYRVTYRDDTTVQVAALALISGDETLNNVVPIRTLLDGTASNVGSNVAANATHRITWDAGADWGVDFGNVTVNIFAKDGRQGLMDIHFLHMPFDGGTTLVINRYPIFQKDLLNVWYWLLATGDSRISLASGEIRGVGGGFDGELLASAASTTQRGREFIFGLMGVRQATAEELTKAREAATPGVVNQWDPVLQVGPGERPKKVNEYGFDTGDYTGVECWWVVQD